MCEWQEVFWTQGFITQDGSCKVRLCIAILYLMGTVCRLPHHVKVETERLGGIECCFPEGPMTWPMERAFNAHTIVSSLRRLISVDMTCNCATGVMQERLYCNNQIVVTWNSELATLDCMSHISNHSQIIYLKLRTFAVWQNYAQHHYTHGKKNLWIRKSEILRD